MFVSVVLNIIGLINEESVPITSSLKRLLVNKRFATSRPCRYIFILFSSKADLMRTVAFDKNSSDSFLALVASKKS